MYWVVDQVWGQDGWILAKFFCYVFMNWDEVHKLAKKERGQHPAILTEQTWSIKDLLYGFRGSSERARWLHLDRSGCQSQHAIWVILPTRRASHIIIYDLPLFCTDVLRFKHQLRSLTFWSTSSPIEINHVNFLIFVGLIYFCFQISQFPFDKIKLLKKAEVKIEP